MARMSLPPGFRFKPTDVELVKYYLKRKVMGKKLRFDAISELNIYKYSPRDLPDKSCLRSKDLEWYFFCPKERKYASGARTNRATPSGYWKSTGKDRPVSYNDESVGMVKTLVFHTGHPPKGERTDWVMYEYRIQDKELADAGVVQDAYVLCKVFQKSGPGPKNGAQYGAPFNEEDWDDDEEVCAESLPSNSFPPPALYYDRNDSVVTSMFVPGSTCSGPLSEPGPSNVLPSADEVPPTVQVNDEDMISLFDRFTEDGSLLPDYNGNNEVENFSHWNNSEGLPCLDGNEIYNSLGDLDNWAELSGAGFNFSSHQTTEYGVNPVLAGDDLAFLELNDLNHPLSCSAEATGSEYFHTDSLCEPCYNNYLEQSYILANSFGAVQHVSAMNQLPVLPEGSNGHGDRFDVSQENVVRGTSSLGFAATCNENFPPSEQPEEGTRHAVQDQKRGEQQRKSYSRLQQLLESLPAHPASAAEHLAPANRAEGFKETSLFTAYCGSSIHVKAEVTRRCGRWCTEDALSEKLGESAYGCCGCNLPGIGFGEKVVNFGSGFAFFFLGMISALIWIFLVGLLPNFAGMLGILLFFNTFCSSVLCHNCWVRYLSSVNRCYSRLLSLADLVLTEIPWLG